MTIQPIKGLRRVDWKAFGIELLAGVDEVGRGCLAGPVYAAAVIFRPEARTRGITDSKLIPPDKRFELAERIKDDAISWAIGVGSVEEIEKINILHASLLAMKRAVEQLNPQPHLLLIDGKFGIAGPWEQRTLIKGDLRCKIIGAASILAKTARDRYMAELDEKFPGYGFGEHKGYATPVHKKAIKQLGPCPMHRRAFAGVREHLPPEVQSQLQLDGFGAPGREPGSHPS